MSYSNIIEYTMIPKDSFSIVRKCCGCGEKAHYISTNKFRVNANGNKVDVWLIYQCEKCKHTYNMTIYERKNPASIPEKEYQLFLENDEVLATEYGKNYSFFKRNRAEVDFSRVEVEYRKTPDEKLNQMEEKRFVIQNPFSIKIRSEKQIADILQISASKVKRMIEQELIQTEQISPQCISIKVNRIEAKN